MVEGWLYTIPSGGNHKEEVARDVEGGKNGCALVVLAERSSVLHG